MTRDEIIRMAEEAGWLLEVEWDATDGFMDLLERFAIVVAQHEREACAKVCESLWNTPGNGMATEEQAYGERCADVIRARGEKR